MEERQIRAWVARGLISAETGDKLIADLHTGGAVGQWADTALLLAASLVTGLVLVGFSLANDMAIPWHSLALLWLLTILPVVYVARVPSVTGLANFLFFAWISLYAFRDMDPIEVYDRLRVVPVLVLASGLLLFQIGGTHFAFKHLWPVARTFRLAGVAVGMIGLYALTFHYFGAYSTGGTNIHSVEASQRFVMAVVVMSVLGSTIAAANFYFREYLVRVTRTEAPISIALFALLAVYSFIPLPGTLTVVLFNAVAAILCGTVLWVAYVRQDRMLIGIASLSVIGLIVGRYVDFQWGRTDATSFGATLAVVLVCSAAALGGGRAIALRLKPSDVPEEAPPEVASESEQAAKA